MCEISLAAPFLKRKKLLLCKYTCDDDDNNDARWCCFAWSTTKHSFNFMDFSRFFFMLISVVQFIYLTACICVHVRVSATRVWLFCVHHYICFQFRYDCMVWIWTHAKWHIRYTQYVYNPYTRHAFISIAIAILITNKFIRFESSTMWVTTTTTATITSKKNAPKIIAPINLHLLNERSIM